MLHMGQGVVEWEAGTGVDCHDTFPAERCISTQTTFVWYRRSELKIPCKNYDSLSPSLSLSLSQHTSQINQRLALHNRIIRCC